MIKIKVRNLNQRSIAEVYPELSMVYKGDKGDTGKQGIRGPKGDTGERGPRGPRGEKGDAFTYEDFTPEQLEGLKGPKGDKGDTGPTGARGVKGDTGEPITISQIVYDSKGNTVLTFSDGTITTIQKGADGKVSFEELTEEQRESLKGEQGNPGKDGKAGADGKSAYVHIAWGNGPAGYKDFSTTDSTDKLYMGVYTDSNEEGSSDAKDYKWSKIKGETGASGKDGEPGLPGKDGTSVTIKSTNKVYDTTTVTFSDGKSIEIKDGAKGNPGEPGKDGAKGEPGEDGKILMKVVTSEPSDYYLDPEDTVYLVVG